MVNTKVFSGTGDSDEGDDDGIDCDDEAETMMVKRAGDGDVDTDDCDDHYLDGGSSSRRYPTTRPCPHCVHLLPAECNHKDTFDQRRPSPAAGLAGAWKVNAAQISVCHRALNIVSPPSLH